MENIDKIEEIISNYEISFTEPKTINQGKVDVRFEQRQIIIRDIRTNQIEMLPISVNSDSNYKEYGELLAIEYINKKN